MNYLKRFHDRVKGDSVVFVGTYPQTPENFKGTKSDTEVQYKNDRLYVRVDALKNDIRTCTETHDEKLGSVRGKPPTETTKTVSVVSVGSDSTTWPPRPAELSGWSIEQRQRWGELANRLEDQGMPFPESERQAYMQISGVEIRRRFDAISVRARLSTLIL